MINNLSYTSAGSFEIKRSYKNLNQISGGRYIKDIKFQHKTIKFIKNYDNEKNKKIKNIKTILNKTIMKPTKEVNNYKNLENTIKAVKTRMSDIILKKKRQSRLQEKLDNIMNEDKKTEYKKAKYRNSSILKPNFLKNRLSKPNILGSQNKALELSNITPVKNKNKKKLAKKQLSIENHIINNSSSIRLNSSINPDETLEKLNISNNDILQVEVNKEKSEHNDSIYNDKNSDNFEKKK